MKDLIEPEEAQILFDDLFKKPIQLLDLAAIPDDALREKLQQHVQAQALLLSLKHVHDRNLQETLETVLVSAFKAMETMGYIDNVSDMLYYLYNEGNLKNADRFWDFLHQQFSHDVEEKVMTLGQKAVDQAVNQAVHQKAVEMAIHLLDDKVDINIISKATKLPVSEIKQLAKKRQH